MRNGTTLVDDPLPDATYLSGGIFVEDDWTLGDRWIVNMGGRVDGIDVSNEANDLWDGRDTSETAWSLHAGTSVGLPGGLRAKCVVASGYRAATLSERYQYLELGGGVRKFGNPDLNPEQSLLTELGIVWTSQRGRAEIAAFRNVLDDMIGEKQEGTVTFRNENIARAEICGAEGRGIWLPASRVELGGQLAWATGRDADSGEFLPRIAPLTGAARAKAGTDSGWWAEAGIRFAAEQRETPDGTDNAPGWCIAEIRVGRDFSAGGTDHSAYVGVRNLADVEYRDYLATSRGTEYLEPGRSVIAGYEARF
jgi:hemoglobin/transferrin/lactoferrin receptor protein